MPMLEPMPVFRDARVTDAVAQALLSEYFSYRASTFPSSSGYLTTLPDPASFTAPHGVFVVVTAQEDSADGRSAQPPSAGQDANTVGTELGCGGVRSLGAGRFEIKHLWVRPGAQGRGVGRALLSHLESRAAALGATEIVLDTNGSLEAAGALYRSSGFMQIEPYNDNPNATHWFGKRSG